MTTQLFNTFNENILTYTSQRNVDFSFTDPSFQLNQEQIEIINRDCGINLESCINIKQVHGDVVAVIDETSSFVNGQEADAIVTDQSNTPILIRTADCLPVFLFDKKHEVIGLVHAGWRGTKLEIVIKTLQIMHQHWQTESSDVIVGFGPAIRSCCYQVGNEFKSYFPDYVKNREGRLFFDLVKVNRDQLINEGVEEENIDDSDSCTCCNKDFYSYRRDGQEAGRMLSLMLKK